MRILLITFVIVGSWNAALGQTLDPYEPDEAIYRADRENAEAQTEYPNGVNVIPGDAELDYPVFHTIPKTSFSCEGRIPGFYADVEARCQTWHTCDVDARMQTFLCPNGTIYSQSKRVCEWWYNVNCNIDEVNRYYEQNRDLFIIPKQSPEELAAKIEIAKKNQYQGQGQPSSQIYQEPPRKEAQAQTYQANPPPAPPAQFQTTNAPAAQRQNQPQNFRPSQPAPPVNQNYQGNQQQNYQAPAQQQQQQRPQNFQQGPPQQSRQQQNYQAPAQQSRQQPQNYQAPAPAQQSREQPQNYQAPAPAQQSRQQPPTYQPSTIPPPPRPAQQNNYQQNSPPPPPRPQQPQNYQQPASPQRTAPQQNNYQANPAPPQARQQNNYQAPLPKPQQPNSNQAPQRQPQAQAQPSFSQPQTQRPQNYQQPTTQTTAPQRYQAPQQPSRPQQTAPISRPPPQQVPSQLSSVVEAATGAASPNRFGPQNTKPQQDNSFPGNRPSGQQRQQDLDFQQNQFQGQNNYDRQAAPRPQQQQQSRPAPTQQYQQNNDNNYQRPSQPARQNYDQDQEYRPNNNQPQQQQYNGNDQEYKQSSRSPQQYNEPAPVPRQPANLPVARQPPAPTRTNPAPPSSEQPRTKPQSAPPAEQPLFTPPHKKFRHSTPRHHNVKFAPARQQFDDGRERQIPSESQQQGFPYAQIYNTNVEPTRAPVRQQSYVAPSTVAPVGPPQVRTQAIRRVPLNVDQSEARIPAFQSEAQAQPTPTSPRVEGRQQRRGQQQRLRTPPSTAATADPIPTTFRPNTNGPSRIVVKPRLENRNQAHETRSRDEVSYNRSLVYPAPIESSEEDDAAIHSQYTSGAKFYGAKQ